MSLIISLKHQFTAAVENIPVQPGPRMPAPAESCDLPAQARTLSDRFRNIDSREGFRVVRAKLKKTRDALLSFPDGETRAAGNQKDKHPSRRIRLRLPPRNWPD